MGDFGFDCCCFWIASLVGGLLVLWASWLAQVSGLVGMVRFSDFVVGLW